MVGGRRGAHTPSESATKPHCASAKANPAHSRVSRIDRVSSSRQISIGGVKVGGGAPIAVQSMTTTRAGDVEATMAQVEALAAAGCEIVRCAVPGLPDAEALRLYETVRAAAKK